MLPVSDPRLTRVIILIFASCLLASSVLANNGTIVLKSGERFTSIDYTIDRIYKVAKFKLDGKAKAVSFTDIETILDSSGNDVTEEILHATYKKAAPQQQQTKETWLDSQDDVYKKANAKPWSLAFVVSPNFTIPSGDYYDGITSGVGFGADLMIPLNSYLALRGTFSMAGSKLEDGFLSQFSGGAFQQVTNDLDISVWRYLVGLQYQRGYGRNNYEKGHWFLAECLGATSHKFSGSAVIRDLSDNNLYTIVPLHGESKFTANTTVGGVSMLSRSVGIQYSGSLDIIYVGTATNNSGYRELQTAVNFDLHLGLMIAFPSKQAQNE